MIGHANEGTPIRELADGRLLFCAVGRAYYIKDYAHGQKLEARLKLTGHLSTTAIVVALMAAAWTKIWWLALFALPAFVLAIFSESFVAVGLEEATDPVGRGEASAHAGADSINFGGRLVWATVALLFMIAPAYFRAKAKSPLQMVEIALMAISVVIAATHFWRQRRLRHEREIVGEPRRFDNSPTVPR